MNYYLIDYENVKSAGLDGIGTLKEDDFVCIFYSEKADSLTFGLHKKLNETSSNVTYQKVDVGTKNALDFQLASYLGYLISENKGKQAIYHIVTKDRGFSSLVNYWKRKKIKVEIIQGITRAKEESEKNELKSQVEELLSCRDDKEAVNAIVQILKQYKTKQGINNALMKKFPSKDNKTASEIYSEIKPLLTNKKGE